MSEVEALAADAISGEVSRASQHALPLGTPCANCSTPLQGAWCHACGQKGEAFHRSIWHLIAEAFEGLTHFDGRFWNTVPRLVTRPGTLTRDYLDGRRASQIPPFRLFLVMILALFFVGSLASESEDPRTHRASGSPVQAGLSPSDRAAIGKKYGQVPLVGWTMERLEHVSQDPGSLTRAMEHWSHRFAILALPLAALILALLFPFRRDIYVFDHLIFAMHSLSFQGMLLTLVMLVKALTPVSIAAVLLAAPVHLFFHMRGAYRIGTVGTLWRMAALGVLSTLGFSLLMLALVVVGLATAH